MIAPARRNGTGAVKLFAEHQPHQLMREGHPGKGEAQRRGLLYLIAKPEGAADNEGERAGSPHLKLIEGSGQLFGGKQLSFDAQCNQAASRGLFEDSFSLCPESRPNLRPGRLLGKPGLLQLGDPDLSESGKPLSVLGAPVGEIALLEPAHRDDLDISHQSRTSLPGSS